MVDQSGSFVNIREMHAMEEKLLARMAAMEGRLLTAIKASDDKHDVVHRDMRLRAEDRHRIIDDALRLEATEDARAVGRSEAFKAILGGLRLLNEFRWLLTLIAIAALVLLNDIRFSIVTP